MTGDASAAASDSQREFDKRIEEVLSEDDPDLLLDMRKLNGNVKPSKYDVLWDELGVFVKELNPAVEECRHSDVLNMLIVISLRHLRDTIKERLQKKYLNDKDKQQCPSLEWIRLHFWSPIPFATSALCYTGRFDLKFVLLVPSVRFSHLA